MRRRFLRLLLAFCAVAPLGRAGFAQQTVLEVIELRARRADDVIPVLRPLLAPGGTISGLQGRLIVRTTPANLAELRRVLDVIDAAPKRLVISVRQEDSATREGSEVEISGSVGSDRARVGVPGTGATGGGTVQGGSGDDALRARVLGTRSDGSGTNVQTVQVLDGNAAFIRLGESVPVRSRTTISTPQGVREVESVEYRNVDTGFYATPRVSGGEVTIQLSARRDAVLDRDTGAARIQRVDSVVSGRLGEWIEVGSIAEDASRVETGTVSRRATASSARRRTYIRVDQIP
ncbi:MAG: secretin N-terminal domain-containing protein [Burkholderiales bacterium]